MNEIRIGVIGCGGMARGHMSRFKEVPRLRFTAASDVVADNVAATVKEHGVQGFASADELLDSKLIDAVLIATPHYYHPQYSIAALERGIHVLTEKPVSVTAKAAAQVNDVAAKHSKLTYAAMFQFRASPLWRKVKQLMDAGRVGQLRRMHWTCTNWLRTQTYYNTGAWRATWKGEGGGVLINQCPHNLDMLCWLLGTPRKVQAHVSLGKYHNIEVEDEVTAYLEFQNGATGLFVTSTGEAPGTDFLEIVGDRGRVTVTDGKLRFDEFDISVDEHIKTSQERFANPPITRIAIEPPAGDSGHGTIIRNFVEHILDHQPLLAPAAEGLHSIELANAIIMSGLTEKTVNIPMDRDGYEALLNELIAKSASKK